MCFIDGLFPEIKAVVLVQRPQNLDAACVLALLKEEAGATALTKQPRSGDWYASSKFQHTPRTPLPLPPPPRTDKGPAPAPGPTVAAPAVKHSSSVDPKLQAVKAYRKALGLCYKCGAKWSKDHTCPPKVLLAVEALWDSFDNSKDGCSEHQDKPVTEQLFVAISKATALGACAARTIRFLGTVAGHPALILIDSIARHHFSVSHWPPNCRQ